MAGTVPVHPKIYHILHISRLLSVLEQGGLLSDAEMRRRELSGIEIGIQELKSARRSLPVFDGGSLMVGDCVPFYFSPRSVMLYMIWKGNDHRIPFRGKQEEIIHLEADLRSSVKKLSPERRNWAFTLSHANSKFRETRSNLDALEELDWNAIQSRQWSSVSGKKQAEFLVERFFSWTQIERIGVFSGDIEQRVHDLLKNAAHRPTVQIIRDWYYL